MKIRIQPHWLLSMVSLVLAAGCNSSKAQPPVATDTTPAAATAAPAATGDGLEILKHSMDAYKGLKTFSAACAWKMDAGQGPKDVSTSAREIYYESPNLYHVRAKHEIGFLQDTVSDGVTMLEWSNSSADETKVMKYDAPASIDKATSTQMMHPMFCGTLLYQFFGGAAGIDALVDTSKGPITKAGPEIDRDGEKAITIAFYGTRQFGHTKALIGLKSGKVYEISYDAEPLVLLMRQRASGKLGEIKGIQITEKYSNVTFDQAISKEKLFAKPPANSKVITPEEESGMPIPLKVGTIAPEFSVVPVAGGSPVTLASLKGKWVLLDFWATWCGPCKEGLPHTEAIYKDFKDKNLVVMAISAEEKSDIEPFWKKFGYTMPAFQDPGHKASDDYKAAAIPMMVLVDPNGKVAYSQLGLTPESKLRQDLEKAGLK